MELIRIIAAALSIVLFVITAASLISNHIWFLRVIDLMREPLIYVMLALAALNLLLAGQYSWPLAAMLLCAVLINAVRIWPYSSFAKSEVELVDTGAQTTCFTALSANVKMENTDYARVIAQIQSIDPDILLMTEIDQSWADAMAPTLERYGFVRSKPQDDTFGKIFATRLSVVGFDVAEQTGEDTPTLHAVIRAKQSAKEGSKEGKAIEFIGLHPAEPMPGQGPDTSSRDASIINASQRSNDAYAGGIAMGDFNDVPWSRTTSRFRRIGNWKDPRIGRGTYPTFPSFAGAWGWPLDQIMVKGDVQVSDFEVLPANGSDHRAVFGRFCLPD